MPGLLVHHQLPELLKLMSIESVMPSSPLILYLPLLLLPSIFSNIRVFSNKSARHIRWPKYWSFSFNISPSNEYSGLISLRMKSLLQYHSSKASILQLSTFFTVQLSHPYTTTGKTIALTRRSFAGKIMSLLFRLVLHWAYPTHPKFIRAKDSGVPCGPDRCGSQMRECSSEGGIEVCLISSQRK